jgi:penicillin G amidase
MLGRKILAVINWLIGLLLVGVIGAVYWFVWRPGPQTSGEVMAPVAAKVVIRRDAHGVPHIEAASIEDTLFAQGYVTAQDRLWQMDMIRRVAAGELSEVIGKATIEPDTMARRLRLRRIAQRQVASLPAADRNALAAYARGVNHFIETHRRNLPPEFLPLRYEPRPWNLSDTLLAALQMYRTLTSTWEKELLKQRLLAAGDAQKVNFLFPVRSGNEVQLGSNAWALSGKWTASGKPILANDPHLEFSMPSTWYLVHLKAPGLDVAGASLPGVPAVIIGHNEQIAWGATNLHFDVQDLYIERLDLQTGQYLFKGQVLQARREPEVIVVNGGQPIELLNWVTVHGPLIQVEGNQPMTLRWIASEEGAFDFPLLQLNQARNFSEFRAALRRFAGPAQNFLYADRAGNIGYQATGRFPIRKGFSGDVPLDGASGDFEWGGFIPFDDLPSVQNPPSGMLVSANQNPFPGNFPYPVGGNYSAPYRSGQIQALLRAHTGWKPEDMLVVQKDVYSAFSQFLAKQTVAAADLRKVTNPSVLSAVQLLRSWNGQMEKGTPQPLIVTLLYQHLRRSIAEKAAPKLGLTYDVEMAPVVVERLLRERPPSWFSDYDKLLVESLSDAVDEGERMQGRAIAKWDYGSYNELVIAHPVAGALPRVGAFLGKYFNIGPVPMSGSSTTVKQTTRRLGPSMRFVADLANWDQTLQNIVTGESGHIFSGHYKDQWDDYYTAHSFQMPFDHVNAASTLTLVPK